MFGTKDKKVEEPTSRSLAPGLRSPGYLESILSKSHSLSLTLLFFTASAPAACHATSSFCAVQLPFETGAATEPPSTMPLEFWLFVYPRMIVVSLTSALSDAVVEQGPRLAHAVRSGNCHYGIA